MERCLTGPGTGGNIAEQDRVRVERCFEACVDRAWRLAYSLVRDSGEAFDAVQQALLVAAKKADRIPVENPWPWFSVVVAHEARNLRRKKRALTNQSWGESDRWSDPGSRDPEQQAIEDESAERLWRAVDGLPEREREAVVLTHVNGWTHARAANALGVPRKTLTSRVHKGLARLRERLGGDDEASLAHSLVVLPVAIPAGGWSAALHEWRSVLSMHFSGGVTTSATVGSLVLAKKLGVVVATTALVAAGWFGNDLMESSDGPAGSVGRGDTAVLTTGAEGEAVPEGVDRERAEESLARLREEGRRLEGENRRLHAEVAELRAQLAGTETASEASVATVGRPVFTFGELGSLEGVLEARWDELALASMEVTDSMKAVHVANREGRQPDRDTLVALQKNVERMRVYEYGVLDRIPSAAKHNGEFTHPISLTNLLAAILEELGLPLSERQVEAIAALGERFEDDFARLRADSADSIRAERLLDEYLLKGDFTIDLYGLLSPEQRARIVDPEIHRTAFLDLYCPTLMIIHTSPIIVGETEDEIRDKLVTLVTQRYGVPEDGAEAVVTAVSGWLESCGELMAATAPRFAVRNYTYDESIVAGEATVDLLRALLSSVELTGENRTKLEEDPVFFIPRRVEPQPQAG